jgi:hypothetical protein
MLLLLMLINPYLFSITDPKAKGLIIISVTSLTIVFPLICVLMMKLLGLIESVQMKGDKERVGPLIATGIFYLWLFINIKDNDMIPEAFSFFVLGSTIALFIGFFLSNFDRISLHTIGIGGLLMGAIIIRFNYAYEIIPLDLGTLGAYAIQVDLIVILTIIIAGIVGTSRLLLGAHNREQIFGGYVVGIFSQLIAYNIIS